MTNVELDATIAALHGVNDALSVTGDAEGARQVAMDKAVCLSVPARRSR